MRYKNYNSGFTLIEILIVMAIIGVLAGLTMGTVSKVKQSSFSAQCQSNLKQIATACILYEQDKGPFPMAANITELVPLLNPAYIQDNAIFDCPAAQGVGNSYDYNGALFNVGYGRSVDTIRGTEAVLVRDAGDARHNNGCNLGFADGHVEHLKFDRLTDWETWGNTL